MLRAGRHATTFVLVGRPRHGRAASVARPLIDGLREEAVVRDDSAARVFGVPQIGFDEAVRLALAETGTPPERPMRWLVRVPAHFARS
jgi:hypothetical protein